MLLPYAVMWPFTYAFYPRMQQLQQWLSDRPEQCIAVVSPFSPTPLLRSHFQHAGVYMPCVMLPCADVFFPRMQQLQQWIAERPEQCIAVVSHWGVLQALTGEDFDNCELQTVKLSELKVPAWSPATTA